jgi:hypothetical protein
MKKVIKLLIIIAISFFTKIGLYNPYDINCDGVVDVRDLLRLQKYIIKKESDKNGKY